MNTSYIITLALGIPFVIISTILLSKKILFTTARFAAYLSGSFSMLVVSLFFIAMKNFDVGTILFGSFIFAVQFVTGYAVVYFLHSRLKKNIKQSKPDHLTQNNSS